MLLFDASVWAAVFDPADRFHRSAKSIVLDLDQPLAALYLTLNEIANVLGVKMEVPDKAHEVVQLVIERCQDRLVVVDASLLHSTCLLAAKYGLTAYDGAYVAAAQRDGAQLISLDIRDLVSKGLAVTPEKAL